MNRYGNIDTDMGTVAFEVTGPVLQEEIDYSNNLYSGFQQTPSTMKVGDYTVMFNGDGHNNNPDLINDLIKENPLLPELFDKQAKFLMAQFPFLYRYNDIDNDGKQQRERIPVKADNIENWLNSWTEKGLHNNYINYLVARIKTYYADGNLYSKFHFNKSRRNKAKHTVPVKGLEHIKSKNARKATTITDFSELQNISDADCKNILTGNWLNPSFVNLKSFPRFREHEPFRFPSAIMHTFEASYFNEFYAYAPWLGMKEVIRASNNNYKYLNSFLKNSIAAKFVIYIPSAWIDTRSSKIKALCDENKRLKAANKPIIASYEGVNLGTEFKESMLTQAISNEVRKMTEFLSGEGDNQGKAFVTQRFTTADGTHEFEFKAIDNKYKEYIESIITLVKQANTDLITGKGLDPSITGISPQGIISKSGSDVLNNFVIYNWSLAIAEYYVTYDINRAIYYNFYYPYGKKQDVFLGFYRKLPALDKQENISPDNRLKKQVDE